MERPTLQLKNNKFEFIKVTGNSDQFHELKQFCGEDIKISYETCDIDDYWLIELEDCLKDTKVVVPNGDFILKLPIGFTMIPASYVKEFFMGHFYEIHREEFNDCNPSNVEGD